MNYDPIVFFFGGGNQTETDFLPVRITGLWST